MIFNTVVPIPKSDFPIGYHSKILSLGSCFAVNMAAQLDYFKFQNTANPFGILFHPLAIERLIEHAVSEKTITQNDVFYHNALWHSFDAHSDCSRFESDELVCNLNAILKTARLQIATSTHVIITLGTAWVYRHIESDVVVANCHKVPQKQFKKELLSIDDISQSIEKIAALIGQVNKTAHLIFTVSPVRHLKDGFVENQRSKSHLIAAIHQTIEKQPAVRHYFPSYEIMMDELRDYRFYAPDMIHPSPTAITYIWERFKDTWITQVAYKTMDDVEAIQKGLAHRPFNPNSESHLAFTSKLMDKKATLVLEYPFMKF